jgi:hypothetical protein
MLDHLQNKFLLGLILRVVTVKEAHAYCAPSPFDSKRKFFLAFNKKH